MSQAHEGAALSRRLLPLTALRAFEAAARLGSVTRAAEELGRTHGAVSRQIRALQEEAGLALFEKAGTGLRLNHHGEALLRCVSGALDALSEGWELLRDEARGPTLHVACSATFAMRWLVPHLASFQRAQPAIRLRLSMTTARELRHEGADLVIAWDRASYPAAEQSRAVLLGEVAFGPVCAPDYPLLVTPAHLRAPVRIGHEHTARAWDIWRGQAGVELDCENELSFPHTHLCIEAAAAGLGVALVERRLVRGELDSGRLMAPCGFARFPDGLAAMPTSERAASAGAQSFLAWLRTTIMAEQHLSR